MPYALLRRHALAPLLAAAVVTAPVAVGSGTAHAAPVTTSESSVTTVADAAGARSALSAAERRERRLRARAHRDPKALARLWVENRYDWSVRQWRCLHRLWQRESGWRVRAANPSGAYGIPQALPGHKMGKGWRTSHRTQVRWGLRYIDDRWGTPCRADRHQRTRGWY